MYTKTGQSMNLFTSILLSTLYGITIRLLFSVFDDYLPVMTLTFFFTVPYFIGYLTIFLIPYKERHTAAGAFFKPWLTCILILIITCALKIEGLICWAMAFPIFAFIAGAGGVVAYNRKRHRHLKKVKFDFEKDDWEKPGALKISLLFFIPIFAGLIEGDRTSTFENLSIQKNLEIHASPEMVWQALTATRQTIKRSPYPTICGVLGFPHHLKTVLDNAAVGGKRVATYEKGLTFFETISKFEPGRRLTVKITTDPSKISKAIMDEHIVIGGEHIRMQGDEYTLEALSNGNTMLSVSSRFSINTPFNWYARLWADWLMSDVLREELESLRQPSPLATSNLYK
jgi:hypothetical protein